MQTWVLALHLGGAHNDTSASLGFRVSR